MSALQHIVVMGVSGAGKSTTGEALARHLGWRDQPQQPQRRIHLRLDRQRHVDDDAILVRTQHLQRGQL